MLTSHYMADVEALCERVIVIHHGRILFDGDLAALADTVAAWKTIAVALENGAADLSAYGEVIHRDGDLVTLRVAEGRDGTCHRTPPRRAGGARPERRGPADRGRDRARLRARDRRMTRHARTVAAPPEGRLRSLGRLLL